MEVVLLFIIGLTAQPASPDQPGMKPDQPLAWDVKKPNEGGVLISLGMVLPTVTRVALNVVGGTVMGAGYAAGKVGEVAGVKKSVDSKAFQASFTTYMWCNGIFPQV